MSNDSNQGREFLGAGLAFPLGADSEGRLSMNSLEEHIRQSILLVLMTAKGERAMRPDFGSGLRDSAFSPLNTATLTLLQQGVKDALLRFEPRIELLGVDTRIDPSREGALLIDVQYRVRRTDTTFNLVFPFYIERGEI